MRGYTLIELMVTVTIIVLVTGSSMAAYLTFNENRQLDVDARNFNTLLNRIRSKAMFLEYPSGCVGLQNFTVSSDLNGSGQRTELKYFANCTSGASEEIVEEVLSSSTFTTDFTLVFLPISGKLESQSDETVVLQSIKGASRTKQITVNQFLGSSNVINNEE